MSYCDSRYFFNCSLKLYISIAMCQIVFMTSILPTQSMDKTSNGNKYFDLFKQINLNSASLNASLEGLGYEHSKLINSLIQNIDYLKRIITKEMSLKSLLDKKQKLETNSTISQIQTKLNIYQQELVRLLGDLDKHDFIHEDDVDAELVSRKRHRGGIRSKRSATAITEKLWDYGVIPYVIEPRFTTGQKETFLNTMRIWEMSTCLVFKEKDAEDKDYLIFTVRSCGCCSFVGKKGDGGQAISIGKNCDRLGIVLHELGHAIGFWHEHTRPDRDKFVEILFDNVLADKKSNFDSLNNSEVNSLDEPYDFESIMHYSRNQFANRSYLDTILARRLPGMAVRPDIGQRIRLSPGDVRQTNKLYNCTSCGKTLQHPSGNLSYTSKLGQPELCQWRITASYGERVQLNVTSLDITYSDNCEKNYLEVRDGHYIKSPSLGRFCGNQNPGLIISSGRRMWLELKTNGGIDEFSAEYVTLCGGSIMKDEEVIASPGYPYSYLPDNLCVWNITVQEGFVVVITFDKLDLESNDNCTFDFLEIRDGHGDSAAVIGRYCGYEHPKEVRSTGNNMSLLFKSDSEVQKSGFSVSFVKEMDECATENHGCDQVCINTIGSYKCECRLGFELHSNGRTCKRECGGYIDESKGNITSPSFPDNYPRNKLCIWTIIAPKGHTISLNFTYFDLEGNSEKCYFDFVAVNREGGKDPRKNDLYCGNALPKPIISKGNVLKMEFKSDGYDEKTGFSALFATDHNECEIKNGGCGQICKNTIGSYLCSCKSGYILQNDHRTCLEGCQKEISAPKGNVTSPDYPVMYPRNLECEWRFSTVLGHRIRLSFKVLDIEPHVECQYDHVLVFDGDNRNTSILGRYCGSTFPEQIISSGTDMLLFFTTDNSVQRKGFEAEHDTVCGTILDATFEPQTLVSHAGYGSKSYEAWEDCEWLFVAPDGMKVEIDFEFFNLEAHAECQYDFVAIYDGDSDNSTNLGVHCGRSVPLRIVSSTNYLFLAFMTDNTINKKGFQLRFQSVAKAPKRTELVD